MTARVFTSAQDRKILDGRAAGRSWRDIGQQLGTNGKACRNQLSRVLGVSDPKHVQVGRKKPGHAPSTAGRDAPRPDAPEGRQAITAGIVLDGRTFR